MRTKEDEKRIPSGRGRAEGGERSESGERHEGDRSGRGINPREARADALAIRRRARRARKQPRVEDEDALDRPASVDGHRVLEAGVGP